MQRLASSYPRQIAAAPLKRGMRSTWSASASMSYPRQIAAAPLKPVHAQSLTEPESVELPTQLSAANCRGPIEARPPEEPGPARAGLSAANAAAPLKRSIGRRFVHELVVIRGESRGPIEAAHELDSSRPAPLSAANCRGPIEAYGRCVMSSSRQLSYPRQIAAAPLKQGPLESWRRACGVIRGKLPRPH